MIDTVEWIKGHMISVLGEVGSVLGAAVTLSL